MTDPFVKMSEAAIRATRQAVGVQEAAPDDATSAEQSRLHAAQRADAHEAQAKAHRSQAATAETFLKSLYPSLHTEHGAPAINTLHSHHTALYNPIAKHNEAHPGNLMTAGAPGLSANATQHGLHHIVLDAHAKHLAAAEHHEGEASRMRALATEGAKNISKSGAGPQSFVLTGATKMHSKDTPCTKPIDGLPIPGNKAGKTPRTVQGQ